MRRGICLIFMFLLVGTALWAAESPSQLMDRANNYYQSKNFEQALEVYQQIEQQNYQSVALYFNLGNTYFRMDSIGQAIYHYEKAKLMDPSNKKVRKNLEIAYQMQEDKIENLPVFFLTRWWNNLRMGLSSNAWSTIGILLLWIAAGGWGLWLLADSRKRKKQGFSLGLAALLLAILPFSLASSRASYEASPGIAILMEPEIALRKAPDKESQVVMDLHEGARLRLVDQIGDWYEIRLGDGEEGWLPKKSFKKL